MPNAQDKSGQLDNQSPFDPDWGDIVWGLALGLLLLFLTLAQFISDLFRQYRIRDYVGDGTIEDRGFWGRGGDTTSTILTCRWQRQESTDSQLADCHRFTWVSTSIQTHLPGTM